MRIMSSIVTAVFKATIGLLVNKGRDKAAEKLRDGDVTDQKFRGLIVREIDDIKSKLDGPLRKDLLASISFFEEGIELLYVVFDKARTRSEHRGEETAQAACAEALSLAEGLRNLELTDLDESATRALCNAKKRFEDARREATRAFKNEALSTTDRILAMQYRVMATILETVDNPADGVAPCMVCIKELNCLSEVQNSFDVHLKKGIQEVKTLFSEEERRKIISSVCQANRVVYDVTQAVGEDEPFWVWPAVDTGEGKVDPLRDGRLTEVLCKQGMKHCCVTPWSFGQGGEEEDKLKEPVGIATNSSGKFIVADHGNGIRRDGNVKFFDSRGNFLHYFSLPKAYETQTIIDVASDTNDNFYLLVRLDHPVGRSWHEVYEFNCIAGVHRMFTLKEMSGKRWIGLTMDDSHKVWMAWRATFGGDVIDMIESDERCICTYHRIGEDTLKHTSDIAAACDGRVMVVNKYEDRGHFKIFGKKGDLLNEVELERCYTFPRIAFHRTSEHIVVADVEKGIDRLHVQVYTKDGEFVRSTQIHVDGIISSSLQGITVTTNENVAAVFQVNHKESKVLVV
ncbi:hypothetical protein ACROYT_G033889 [Oculina patagonica]